MADCWWLSRLDTMQPNHPDDNPNGIKDMEENNEKVSGLQSVEYHKRCRDCGRFLKKAEWVKKDNPRKAQGLCWNCLADYD